MKWFNKTWDIRPDVEVYNESLLLSSSNLLIKEMREISDLKNEINTWQKSIEIMLTLSI